MIRDRGKMKWQGAFFMPEHVKMLGGIREDYLKTDKPSLDEHQYHEFDECISLAQVEGVRVKITIWQKGYNHEVIGSIISVDALTKVMSVELDSGAMERVQFNDIIGVSLV